MNTMILNEILTKFRNKYILESLDLNDLPYLFLELKKNNITQSDNLVSVYDIICDELLKNENNNLKPYLKECLIHLSNILDKTAKKIEPIKQNITPLKPKVVVNSIKEGPNDDFVFGYDEENDVILTPENEQYKIDKNVFPPMEYDVEFCNLIGFKPWDD